MIGEKKRKVHPIVEKALYLAHVGEERIEFDDEDIDELKEDLEELFGQDELFNAVVDLINFKTILDEKGCPNSALQIIGVISTAADALQALNKKKGNFKK